MRDQANPEGHHRGAQQHRRRERAYFKGAESDAGQIDGHQNADEPVTKRAHASRSEQEANIASLWWELFIAGAADVGVFQEFRRHTRSD